MPGRSGPNDEPAGVPARIPCPPRREFSRAQKVAMIKRAMTKYGMAGTGAILCEGCGLNIIGKAIEFDHIIPEALILDKNADLSIADGRTDQAALAQFHQDDAICKGEVAKAQAVAAPIYMGRNLADAMEACWRGSATMRSGRSWSAAWLSAATP